MEGGHQCDVEERSGRGGEKERNRGKAEELATLASTEWILGNTRPVKIINTWFVLDF